MSIRAVETSLSDLCAHLEDRFIASTSEEFIEEHRREIASAATVLEENDKKLKMISHYVEEWKVELARVKKQHEVAVQRRDLLRDVATALKHKFPAMRIADQPADSQPTLTQTADLSLQSERVDHSALDGSSVHSFASRGAGAANPDASVLRDVINNAVAIGTAQAKAARSRKQPRRAPLPYVTKKELDACSRHLVGRLTEHKVNAALEELAGFAEQNAADLAKLKSRTTTFRDASKRKRLQALEALTREHRAMQTRMWFLQSDTKRGTAVKFDKTGQALLQLLRHLKRVSEIRCKLAGEADIIYVYEAAST